MTTLAKQLTKALRALSAQYEQEWRPSPRWKPCGGRSRSIMGKRCT